MDEERKKRVMDGWMDTQIGTYVTSHNAGLKHEYIKRKRKYYYFIIIIIIITTIIIIIIFITIN